jgi:hypothetical protein
LKQIIYYTLSSTPILDLQQLNFKPIINFFFFFGDNEMKIFSLECCNSHHDDIYEEIKNPKNLNWFFIQRKKWNKNTFIPYHNLSLNFHHIRFFFFFSTIANHHSKNHFVMYLSVNLKHKLLICVNE